MKTLFLLPILLFLALTSCKDEGEVTPVSEPLTGDWMGVKLIRRYYDEKNQQVYSTVHDIEEYWSFQDRSFTMTTNPMNTPVPQSYWLSEGNGKRYITVQHLPENPYELTIASNGMVWVNETENTTYLDDATNEVKEAHRMVTRQEFVRK